MYQGLQCELYRRQIYNVHIDETIELPNMHASKKFGLSSIQRMCISIKQTYENVNQDNETNNNQETDDSRDNMKEGCIQFFSILKPNRNNIEIKEYIMKTSNIIVFDHGLHWKVPEGMRFEQAMTTLLGAYYEDSNLDDNVDDNGKEDINLMDDVNNSTTSSSVNNDTESNNNIPQQQQQQHHYHHVYNPLKLIAWRQTSAQHFHTPGGHYSPDRSLPSGCTAHNRSTVEENDIQGFHYQHMIQAAYNNNVTVHTVTDPYFHSIPIQYKTTIVRNHRVNSSSTTETTTTAEKKTTTTPSNHQNYYDYHQYHTNNELIILPFRSYTSQLYYMHPSEISDCAHFCYNPYVWLPVWYTLRIALDRTVQQQPILQS